MKEYKYSSNYDFPLLAELYDKFENYNDDIELIRSLIDGENTLNILELFSGTGRIILPLALDGHKVTGIEIAKSMIDRAKIYADKLEKEIKNRITLKQQDVLDGFWGSGYDLIIIGANALYELPSVDMQEDVIRYSYEALNSGGYLFIDNDDYKGNWAGTEIGKQRIIFEGNGKDGSYGRFTVEGLMVDEENNTFHMKRTWFSRESDGAEMYTEYLSSKHPVTEKEVEEWLGKYNFRVIEKYGDRRGNPFTKDSERAIFWAKKI